MIRRKFTLKDGIEFAKLSGDYNPIHVDPLMARRYMFGQPIVHGLHVVLWALDIWFEKKDSFTKLNSIKVSFPKPVFLEKIVEYKLVLDSINHPVIEVIQNKILCAKIKLEVDINMTDSLILNTNSIIDGKPKKHSPNNLTIEDIIDKTGVLDLYLDRREFSAIFPNIFKNINEYKLAALLSITRLVGMDCPGLNSLISTLDISFKNEIERDAKLNYSILKVDRRFGLIIIKLSGLGLEGLIKTFMRPTPVSQMSYLDVKTCVKHNEFEGQRALVIGGSRGLGEITTKILAAGDASVRFTYNKGEIEAQSITNEILSNSGRVDMVKVDVLDENSISSALSGGWNPTHCYYFATPFIFSGNKRQFSEALFNEFNSVYISAFIKLVSFLKSRGTLNYFYPSTTAIDELPDNMIEYTISKYAAQKACDILQSIYGPIKIETPKFPRMATDQTISFLPVKNQEPFALTLSFLKSFSLSSIK